MGTVIRLTGSLPIEVDIGLIDPPSSPLRIPYDGEDEDLLELGNSMLQQGQMNPIQVFVEGERYRCAAGDRRLRSAKAVNAARVWIAVVDARDEADTIALQLVENVQRRSLDPYEEASAYLRMCDLGLSLQQIAQKVGKRDAYVRERLQFASAVPAVHEHVIAGVLSPKQASIIARLSDGEDQLNVAQTTIHDKLTTEQVRELVSDVRSNPLNSKPRHYLAPGKTLIEAARVQRWLQMVGKKTNFNALTANDIRTMRAAFNDIGSVLQMVNGLLEKAARKVPAAAGSVFAETSGNVPDARNHGDEWPAGHIATLEAWLEGTRICPIEDLAREFGRTVGAVEQMIKAVRRRTKKRG